MRIVLLVGLPGSGKSTWLAQNGGGGISSDAVRKLLADDETNQSIHTQVFQTVRYLLEQRIAIGRPLTYIDATSLTPEERRPYIEIARLRGCEIEAVFFDVPLAICLERNARRARVVPPEAMEKMAAKLIPPETAEGFSKVTRVSTTENESADGKRPCTGTVRD
jgi:predicted kinase